MPAFTIIFGIALMTIGIGTYIGSGEGADFWAFFLQMLLGLLAIGLGVGSIIKKPMKMHLMHAAVVLSLLGVVVPIIRFSSYLLEMERAQQMQLLRALLTALFSGAYIYVAVQSFRAARRSRKADTPTAPAEPPREPKIEEDPTPSE